MARYKKSKPSLERIKKISGNILRNMSYEELLPLAEEASKLAISRRNDFLQKAKAKGIKTIAPSYRQWSNEHDDFSSYLEYDFSLKDIDFSNKEKRLGQLKHKFKLTRDFLTNETSLFNQWEKLMKEFADRIEMYTAINISKRNYGLLWDIYNELLNNADIPQGYDSTQLQKEITQLILNFKSSTSAQIRYNYKKEHNLPTNVRLNREELKLAYLNYFKDLSYAKYEESEKIIKDNVVKNEPKNPNDTFRAGRKGR